MFITTGMARSIISSVCETPAEAIWVAEALCSQIEALRGSLDHRALFSAAFNRKLVRKIELLDSVRQQYLELASDLQRQFVIPEFTERAVSNGKST